MTVDLLIEKSTLAHPDARIANGVAFAHFNCNCRLGSGHIVRDRIAK